MATGAEMLMASLRRLVPDHIWQAVEKNLFSIGGTAQQMQNDMRELKEMQARILRLLEPRHLLFDNKTQTIVSEASHGESATDGHGKLASVAKSDDTASR